MIEKLAFLESFESKTDKMVDYLKPIIADGDMGGSPNMCMKLAKLFAEKGAAAIHLEDQLLGGKRCGHLGGAVIVPTGDQLSRLVATRFQWDIMGTENLIIARTDSCNAKLLSSSSDPRDHEFIKGVIDPNLTAWSEELIDMETTNTERSIIQERELKWYNNNQLMTFDEAVEMKFNNEEYKQYLTTKKHMMDKELKRPYLS